MHDDLFSAGATLTPIPIDGGELHFLEQLPMRFSTQQILDRLLRETAWRAQTITLWGKQYLQPRLIAWHGDAGAGYAYSGTALTPLPWTALLAELKREVEAITACSFNSVLLNYYRDQRDSVGMHSDDESMLGARPAIASLSFGATRTFTLKHKFDKTKKPVKLRLEDGNLLLMTGDTQQNWLHGVSKETRPCGPRVNLTFRKILRG